MHHVLAGHFYRLAGARIAAGTWLALANDERAETPDLDPFAEGDGGGDRLDDLHYAMVDGSFIKRIEPFVDGLNKIAF